MYCKSIGVKTIITFIHIENELENLVGLNVAARKASIKVDKVNFTI